MSKSKKNFWNGEEAGDTGQVSGKDHKQESESNDTRDSQKDTGQVSERDDKRASSSPKRGFTFEWWYAAAGVFIVAVIVAAIFINSGYNHNGDNASNISGSLKIDNGDTKINWDRYGSSEINLDETEDGENYVITEAGTYNVSGSLLDGAVIIRATEDSPVRLILNNATIKNTNGPAIACYTADDLVIELVGSNTLEDGEKYSGDWDEEDGVIYSKADLSFLGDGKLTVKANYQDGIVGKDDLSFRGGTYKITAADDAVRGKDSVYIESGEFTIDATSDGIKSTNETDTTKGFILIEDGEFSLKTGAKGIKATNSILIYGGDFIIDSTDDSVHSNNYVGIIDGNFDIASGDDGVHADARLIIDGGTIKITKSYEGLEAQRISINGGDISIVSNDDGINAGGGADSSATGRAGAGAFNADENCELAINGGSLYVNAAGDGLDSNGWLYINGGKVVVDGPTSNGDGALDSGSGIMMSGGTAITVGASGMAETLGSSSSVNNISVYLSSTQAKGTKIEIKNSAGATILSHTAAKTFSHIATGTSDFKTGETYMIYLNGTLYESFTIDGTTTTVGNNNGGFQNMNMNMQRGQR